MPDPTLPPCRPAAVSLSLPLRAPSGAAPAWPLQGSRGQPRRRPARPHLPERSSPPQGPATRFGPLRAPGSPRPHDRTRILAAHRDEGTDGGVRAAIGGLLECCVFDHADEIDGRIAFVSRSVDASAFASATEETPGPGLVTPQAAEAAARGCPGRDSSGYVDANSTRVAPERMDLRSAWIFDHNTWSRYTSAAAT